MRLMLYGGGQNTELEEQCYSQQQIGEQNGGYGWICAARRDGTQSLEKEPARATLDAQSTHYELSRHSDVHRTGNQAYPRPPPPLPHPPMADFSHTRSCFDSTPRVIECYADRFAVVGGRRYMIGHPCDWAVSICIPTEEGKVEAVPLGSELMEELVPGLQVGFAIIGDVMLSGGGSVLSPPKDGT